MSSKKLNATLYEHQREGLAFHLLRPYAINADQMGLGKSVEALAVAQHSNSKKVLVVAPAHLKHNWHQEIKKFTPERIIKGTIEDTGNWNIQVISYEYLLKMKDFGAHDMIVADEAHYLKNPKAKRTKIFHELLETYKPTRFMPMSGTPIKNRVPEFWSLLRLVWLGGKYDEFRKYSNSYHSFCNDFTNVKRFKIGGRSIQKYEGVKNTDKLIDLIRPIYLRRKAEDVLNLPDQVRQEVLQADRGRFDLGLGEAWRAYEGKKQSNTFASGKAVNALAKVPFTCEFVENLLESTDRVMVFTDHVQSAKKLYSNFGDLRSKFICGDTPISRRSIYVDDFNAGKIPVLVATVGSLSVGINLTSCSYMVFNDFPWVPADMEQAEKRIHRIGQDATCFYYYMLSSKIDQRIFRTLDSKRNLVELITEVKK